MALHVDARGPLFPGPSEDRNPRVDATRYGCRPRRERRPFRSHLFYSNRQFVYSLRPAREGAPEHNPCAPGLHHLCFRVVDEAAVVRAARELREAGIEATEPRYYPEYAPDNYATFFNDPDSVRLEVKNFREIRRKVMYDWEARAGL